MSPRDDTAEDNVVVMPIRAFNEDYCLRVRNDRHPRAVAMTKLSWKWIERVVKPSVTAMEAAVAILVLFGTVWQRRTTVTVTYDVIIDVLSDNVDFYRVTSNKTALRRAVKSLEGRGLLVIHGIGQKGMTLSLNLQWTPDVAVSVPDRTAHWPPSL